MTSRQEAILQASAAAIAENGVRGLRVSDIARVAGVSSGLLYYHFKDRDGLLAAALTYINDQAREYRQAASGSGVSRRQLIEHILGEIQDSPAVLENSLVWNELRACAVYEEAMRERWREHLRSGRVKPPQPYGPPKTSGRYPNPWTPSASPRFSMR